MPNIAMFLHDLSADGLKYADSGVSSKAFTLTLSHSVLYV